LVDEHRYSYSYNSMRLSDHFNRPGVIEENENLDKLSRGMAFQPQEESDQWIDREVKSRKRSGKRSRAGAPDVAQRSDPGWPPSLSR
jgi:hypothetical protein